MAGIIQRVTIRRANYIAGATIIAGNRDPLPGIVRLRVFCVFSASGTLRLRLRQGGFNDDVLMPGSSNLLAEQAYELFTAAPGGDVYNFLYSSSCVIRRFVVTELAE